MNWMQIITLLLKLWPIIEKIINAIEGRENKAIATDRAIAAIVRVATTGGGDEVMVKDDALLAAVEAVNNVA